MSCVHWQNYARVWGAYSTKFYLGRLRSKVQSGVMCENAQYFYEKEFLEGMWGPSVYDCYNYLSHRQKLLSSHFLKLFLSTASTPALIQRRSRGNTPLKVKKKSGKRKVLAHCLLMSDHFATVHCKNTRVIRPDPQLVFKLFSLHNMDLMVNYVEKLIQCQCRELVKSG